MTTILGVSCLYHDAAAAVVRDGEIIAAAQEERFTRKKHDRHYPEAAIAYCIDQTGGAEALDAVVFYEDPVLSLDRILKNAIELAPATGQTWAAAARSQLGQSLNVAERLRQILPPRAGDNVFFVDHHLSHAADRHGCIGCEPPDRPTLDGRERDERHLRVRWACVDAEHRAAVHLLRRVTPWRGATDEPEVLRGLQRWRRRHRQGRGSGGQRPVAEAAARGGV